MVERLLNSITKNNKAHDTVPQVREVSVVKIDEAAVRS